MLIEEIRNAIRNNIPVEYSAHCQKRMSERGILRQDILNCINTGIIIEDYPVNDNNNSFKSLPCCLILGSTVISNNPIHIVVGFNGYRILIISACYPDRNVWLEDNRTRRKKDHV